MTKQEWLDKYTARIIEVAGWSLAEAMPIAVSTWDEEDAHDLRDPVEAADDEMSYWADDEAKP